MKFEPCPFDNYNCMCQFCEEKCNKGLNCFECEREGKPVHSVYLCTGFAGKITDYIKHWRNRHAGEEEQDG